MAKRITIQLVGSAQDKEDVRLGDFIDQLSSIKRALRENEAAIFGEEEPALDYKIVDLRHNSPSEMVLEPVPLRPVPAAYSAEVLAGFATELKTIKKEGKTTHEPELGRLNAYQEIGAKSRGKIVSVRISVGRTRVTLDDKFKGRLENILGPDQYVDGSVSGYLEAINLHNTNSLAIYPDLGPKKISGKFPAELREAVKRAIGSYVTATGRLSYKSWAPYPHAVRVSEINIHPPDGELPTLFDLRGSIPGLTGKESSVEFVERIRNENW